MCSGLAESPSSIAVVACIRSAPELGLSQQPLLTTLLPSLARTTTPLERRRLNVCLYLCAQDDDQFLLDQAKELRRLVASKASFVGMRLGFYPSIHEGLNSAMLCAYADGAKFFHRTFDNVRYTRTDWLGNALGELARGERFIVRPSVATRPPATGWPSLVSRRHLDAFEQFHPPQLHGEPLDSWLTAAYAGASRQLVAGGGGGAGDGDSRGGRHNRADRMLAEDEVHDGTVATPMHPLLLPALVECGRHVLAGFEKNSSAARASCVAYVQARGDIQTARRVAALSIANDCRLMASGASGAPEVGYWCAVRARPPARAHIAVPEDEDEGVLYESNEVPRGKRKPVAKSKGLSARFAQTSIRQTRHSQSASDAVVDLQKGGSALIGQALGPLGRRKQ